LEQDKAKKFAIDFLKTVPNKKIKGNKTLMYVPELNDTYTNSYDFEQVNIDLNYIAPKLTDKDFNAMTVIQLLLDGSRGRIFKAVRGENQDLAYFAFPQYGYTKDYGYFRISTQTSIDKKDEIIQVLKDEVEKIKTEAVSIEEINSAIEEHSKILKSYLNDNQLPSVMTKYEAIGLGYNYINTSESELKKVTPEEIKTVANKYFKNVAVFVSVPNDKVDLMVD